MTRCLLYFVVIGDEYIAMFNMLLRTIFLEVDDVNILVITNEKYKHLVENLLIKYGIKQGEIFIKTHQLGGFYDYSAKLDIIFWPKLNLFDKVIYSDVDMLFKPGAIKTLFTSITNKDEVYICQENVHFTAPWFYHKEIYTEEETAIINEKGVFKKGLNTGIFGWINSENCKVQNQIARIRENVMEKSTRIITNASEQPYINHRLLVDQNINGLFGYFVTIFPLTINDNKIVYHFTFNDKVDRMREFLPLIIGLTAALQEEGENKESSTN